MILCRTVRPWKKSERRYANLRPLFSGVSAAPLVGFRTGAYKGSPQRRTPFRFAPNGAKIRCIKAPVPPIWDLPHRESGHVWEPLETFGSGSRSRRSGIIDFASFQPRDALRAPNGPLSGARHDPGPLRQSTILARRNNALGSRQLQNDASFAHAHRAFTAPRPRRDDEPRVDRRESRAHRRPGRRRRAGVSDGLCRAGPRRGRRHRRRSEERRGAAPFRRRSAVDQGPFRRRGRADPRGIARARRRARGARRRRDGGACAPRGVRRRRQDQYERIRLFGARRERALRDAAQPLGSRARAYPRRLDFRRSGQRRRRPGARDARHRHRRLVPHPGGLLRDRRLQADARPRVAEGRLSA